MGVHQWFSLLKKNVITGKI